MSLESCEIPPAGPKLVGAHNLIHLDVFNPGNFAIPLQATQDIRGSMNHWGNANRIWRWLAEPINQLLGQSDTAILWLICGNQEKCLVFWHVMQFPRDVATNDTDWRNLSQCTFSELAGAQIGNVGAEC